MINRMVLCIGSNIQDRECLINSTIKWIEKKFIIISRSDIYESVDETNAGNSYFNTVISAITHETYKSTVTLLKQWEAECGRTPESKQRATIPIDIDIVIWNDKIIRQLDFNKNYFKKGYEQLFRS